MWQLIDALYNNVYRLRRVPFNEEVHKIVNNNVADIVQHGVDHSRDYDILSTIYNVLIEVYMTVIDMDIKVVQDVIDTLVMARMIIKNAMDDVPNT
jgi:hypothetical protein